MTVSSLTSVSLEPPLLGVCCDLKSHTLHLLRDVGKFAVTILAAHQRELSIRFAAPEFESIRFEGQAYTLGHNGCPLLDEGLVFFECSVMSRVPAGDHELVLGAVDRVSNVEGEPLAYWAGSYRSLTT
jgi:3-hydroxy-9,10-secoandrosta-1,3,5(10)-triene-9,17-dione monooxygenase reductase component